MRTFARYALSIQVGRPSVLSKSQDYWVTERRNCMHMGS
jgi:hypothetical protein